MNLRSSVSPFDLEQPQAYARWRAAKLASQPRRVEDLIVDVADPRALSDTERDAMLQCCARANMVIYRSPIVEEDKALPRLLGAQLGLHRLDANWLADEDGISPIAVADNEPPTPLRVGPPQGDHPAWGGPAPNGRPGGARTDFIPYTDKPIKWHTDGYYHPQARRIEGMILHCVRAAGTGGVSGLVDHDMIYIALRDANPAWVRALMAEDAMTIPQRADANGVARPAQSGPVFYVSADGALQMRYTARTRSIEWKDEPLTREAVAFIEQVLASDAPWIFRLTLQPGMGIVANNVPHERSAFVDDPRQPRLLYRARYLDRIAASPLVPRSSPEPRLQEAVS